MGKLQKQVFSLTLGDRQNSARTTEARAQAPG